MTDESETNQREMFDEIAALMGGIAKAFDLDESQTITAVEKGTIEMKFETDANGNPFVLATYGEKSARLYAGAVKQEAGAKH
ncbi:MAG: hypothetical protein GKS03_04920 [Alphaproteobacteria bacterium]|nr:hypothetical protein [Alphaproteobacteria bacterium]